MKNDKGLIATVKKLIFNEEEVAEIKMADYKTEDNRVVRADNLDVETAIYEVSEDGENPLEDGDYVIVEDDVPTVKISVAGGLITASEEVAEEEEESTDAPAEAPAEEEMEQEVRQPETVTKETKFAKLIQINKWEIEVDNDSFDVGSKVTGTNDDGSKWTLDSGEYELEDGTKVQLDADGIVIMVTPAGESDVPAEAPAEETEKEDSFEKVSKQLEELSKKFENIEKENKELTERFNKIAGEPAEKSVVEKVDFREINRDEKLKFFGRR